LVGMIVGGWKDAAESPGGSLGGRVDLTNALQSRHDGAVAETGFFPSPLELMSERVGLVPRR